MPLRLERDELRRLPEEVDNIKSIHLNRHLSLPIILETRKLQIEAEEILVSTWGVEQIKALSVWGAYGARGKGVTIGLLDTGIDAKHPDLQGKVTHWAEFDSLGNEVPESTPHDTDEHGTHCAGTLVGANVSRAVHWRGAWGKAGSGLGTQW
jgi:subtilisin family serine protease